MPIGSPYAAFAALLFRLPLFRLLSFIYYAMPPRFIAIFADDVILPLC